MRKKVGIVKEVKLRNKIGMVKRMRQIGETRWIEGV
jgi:hypothetical protein